MRQRMRGKAATDEKARIRKSRQGRPKVAHGFNRGLRVENGPSPGRRRAEAALFRLRLWLRRDRVVAKRRRRRAAKAGGAKETMELDRRVLSSLTGLVLY